MAVAYVPAVDVVIMMVALPSPPLFLAVTVMEMVLNSSTLLTMKDLLSSDTVLTMVETLAEHSIVIVSTVMKYSSTMSPKACIHVKDTWLLPLVTVMAGGEGGRTAKTKWEKYYHQLLTKNLGVQKICNSDKVIIHCPWPHEGVMQYYISMYPPTYISAKIVPTCRY